MARWAWQPPAASVVCVCGVRGAGKSFWARDYMRPVVRVAAWDVLDEYGTDLGGERIPAGEFLARAKAGEFRTGIVRLSIAAPDEWEGDALEAGFDDFCRAVALVGNLLAVVEEVSLVASPSTVPPLFKRLLAVGRHFGVSLLIVGQRFAQFPRLATGMASRIVAFRQSEPSDVADLGKRLGEIDGRDAGEIARTLPPHHRLEWRPETGAQLLPPLGA